MLDDLVFVAASGYTCRCRFEEKEGRIGVSCTWSGKPNEEDLREASRAITEWLKQQLGETSYSQH